MSSQLHELMQKRSVLLARIAAQREQVAAETARLKLPLAVADRGLEAARYLRAHPLILVGVAGVVAFLAVRRNGLVGLAGNAMRLLNLYNSARSFSAKSVSRP